jgi:dihydroorotase-like cyclic amidohydrolase
MFESWSDLVFRWISNSIPGIETRFPILFSEGVSKGRMTFNRFVALTATNHAKTYGLVGKGSIPTDMTPTLQFGPQNEQRSYRRRTCTVTLITRRTKA